MSHGTHTHWRMTINNYDATDLALVQQGYPDDIRQLVYTLEEGKEGTPHIQAFIKMKRDCRMSHMSKLFPRGNFAYLDSAEYRLNSQRYAQKLDATARSPAVIQNGDPLHTIEGTVRRVVTKMIKDYPDVEDIVNARRNAERDMVLDDYTMAKVFVSSTYKTMWKEFGNDMYECLFKRHQEELAVEIPVHTHTHTHADEKFSHADGITNAGGEEASCSEGTDAEEDAESQHDGSCASSVGTSESGSVGSGATDDSTESGEQSGGLDTGSECSAQQRNRVGGCRAPRGRNYAH